jgi:hypothetical protein
MANQTEERDPFSDAGDDPFEEASPSIEEANAAEEAAMGDAELQTGDREGQPVEAQPVTSAQTDAPAPPTPESAPEPSDAPDAPPEQPAEAQQAAQEPQNAAEAAQDAPETGDDASGGETGGEAAASGSGPRGGSSPLRNYKIMYQTGDGQWTEVKLDPDNTPDGVTVVKKDDSLWVEARNNEHALRIGYVLLGRPENGARILPIPQGGWKAKLVRKAAPRPERERLEIG